MASAIHHAKAVIDELFGDSAIRPFGVVYWDGTANAGSASSRFEIAINRPGTLRRMLLPPSEVSIVEAFLSGDIDVRGDIEHAASLGDTINARLRSVGSLARLTRHLLALPSSRPLADDE